MFNQEQNSDQSDSTNDFIQPNIGAFTDFNIISNKMNPDTNILSTQFNSPIDPLPQSNFNTMNIMNNKNIIKSMNSMKTLNMNGMNNMGIQPKLKSFNNMGSSRHRNLQVNVHYDWSKYMGPVRSQGNCGACYALATTDVLASLLRINKFEAGIPQLSAQQMIDCSNNGLTDGCNGGFIEGAYAFLQKNGLNLEKDYPYASMLSGTPG
jgi:C1A family cysteine protease